MIQRIQSVWLFLTSVLVFSLFLFPYLHFVDAQGQASALKINGLYGVVEGQVSRLEINWLQLIMTVFVGLLPFYIISQFKNRKKQIALTLLAFTLLVLLELWILFMSISTMQSVGSTLTTGNLGVGFFLLPIALIFVLLALSAIRKDMRLIKSVDRLR